MRTEEFLHIVGIREIDDVSEKRKMFFVYLAELLRPFPVEGKYGLAPVPRERQTPESAKEGKLEWHWDGGVRLWLWFFYQVMAGLGLLGRS